jgi:hypothetical protein
LHSQDGHTESGLDTLGVRLDLKDLRGEAYARRNTPTPTGSGALCPAGAFNYFCRRGEPEKLHPPGAGIFRSA